MYYYDQKSIFKASLCKWYDVLLQVYFHDLYE